MLRSLGDLTRLSVRAKDGPLGPVTDLYFDDSTWTVRHAVVDTGAWLPGRRVLLATSALGPIDPGPGELAVDLTKEQVRNAPDVDADRPVSRQQEEVLYGYYGWHPYWAGAGYAPVSPAPHGRPPGLERAEPPGDPHLRSGREVVGYGIAARDGAIGHVEDLLVEDADWRVRYLVVDTRDWLPGRKVVVAPPWVRAIDWADRSVEVDLSREQIRSAPELPQGGAIDRGYEEALHRHHGREPYWR